MALQPILVDIRVTTTGIDAARKALHSISTETSSISKHLSAGSFGKWSSGIRNLGIGCKNATQHMVAFDASLRSMGAASSHLETIISHVRTLSSAMRELKSEAREVASAMRGLSLARGGSIGSISRPGKRGGNRETAGGSRKAIDKLRAYYIPKSSPGAYMKQERLDIGKSLKSKMAYWDKLQVPIDHTTGEYDAKAQAKNKREEDRLASKGVLMAQRAAINKDRDKRKAKEKEERDSRKRSLKSIDNILGLLHGSDAAYEKNWNKTNANGIKLGEQYRAMKAKLAEEDKLSIAKHSTASSPGLGAGRTKHFMEATSTGFGVSGGISGGTAVNASMKNMKKHLQDTGQAAKQTGTFFQKLFTGMRFLGSNSKMSVSQFGAFGQQVSHIKGPIMGFVGSMMAARLALAGVSMALHMASRAVINFEKESVTAYLDIERGIQSVLSVAGQPTTIFNEIKESVQDAAIKTGIGTDVIVQSLNDIARAGFTGVEDMKSLSAETAKFQIANAASADAASTIVVSTATAWKLGAKELPKAMDVWSMALNDTLLDAEKLKAALPLIGASAKAMGLNIEESAAALGTMSQSGAGGSRLGTGFRHLEMGLTGKKSKKLDALGIDTGTLKTATDKGMALYELGKKMQRLSSQQRADIFGLQGLPVVNTFIERVEDYRKELIKIRLEAEGYSDTLLSIKLDTASGQLDRMKSAVSVMKQEFGSMQAPFLKMFGTDMVNSITKALRVWRAASKERGATPFDSAKKGMKTLFGSVDMKKTWEIGSSIIKSAFYYLVGVCEIAAGKFLTILATGMFALGANVAYKMTDVLFSAIGLIPGMKGASNWGREHNAKTQEGFNKGYANFVSQVGGWIGGTALRGNDTKAIGEDRLKASVNNFMRTGGDPEAGRRMMETEMKRKEKGLSSSLEIRTAAIAKKQMIANPASAMLNKQKTVEEAKAVKQAFKSQFGENALSLADLPFLQDVKDQEADVKLEGMRKGSTIDAFSPEFAQSLADTLGRVMGASSLIDENNQDIYQSTVDELNSKMIGGYVQLNSEQQASMTQVAMKAEEAAQAQEYMRDSANRAAVNLQAMAEAGIKTIPSFKSMQDMMDEMSGQKKGKLALPEEMKGDIGKSKRYINWMQKTGKISATEAESALQGMDEQFRLSPDSGEKTRRKRALGSEKKKLERQAKYGTEEEKTAAREQLKELYKVEKPMMTGAEMSKSMSSAGLKQYTDVMGGEGGISQWMEGVATLMDPWKEAVDRNTAALLERQKSAEERFSPQLEKERQARENANEKGDMAKKGYQRAEDYMKDKQAEIDAKIAAAASATAPGAGGWWNSGGAGVFDNPTLPRGSDSLTQAAQSASDSIQKSIPPTIQQATQATGSPISWDPATRTLSSEEVSQGGPAITTNGNSISSESAEPDYMVYGQQDNTKSFAPSGSSAIGWAPPTTPTISHGANRIPTAAERKARGLDKTEEMMAAQDTIIHGNVNCVLNQYGYDSPGDKTKEVFNSC